MNVRRSIGALTIVVVSLAAGGCSYLGAVKPSGQDEAFLACGVSDTENVLADFPLAHASEFWEHVPRAGAAPELEREDAAYVVVFDGPRTIGVMGVPPADGELASGSITFDGVVCVSIKGQPNFYVNIDLTDLHP